jgi:hypothetical protein
MSEEDQSFRLRLQRLEFGGKKALPGSFFGPKI